jgi:adenylate cyclase
MPAPKGKRETVADIFLSYNREDQAIARAFAEGLSTAGFSVWWDATLRSGEAYDEVTETALRTARAVVVLWSPRSVISRWVRAEATVADRNKTLVPVTIEACERPIMFELTQTADLTQWRGEADHPAWLALIADLHNFLGREMLESRAILAASAFPAAPLNPVLAVLPFDNLAGDREMTYFSDGISEEILHTIARAHGLSVIGKTSSFQFRGAEKTTRRIVDELRATHMLDGSVRRTGNRVRISAQLIDTATQMTLWSDRYDRDLTDIFALQDEIAAAIAAALDAHFTPAAVPAPVDPDAYDRYLQARAIYAQDMTSADIDRCVALLTETVTRAPNFAMAWGLLAMFRGLALPRSSFADGAALRPAAEAAGARALALDPECGPAFMALALLQPAFAAYAEKRRLADQAFQLTAGDPAVAVFYAVSLATTGQLREACRVFDDLVKREPLSPYYAALRAHFYRSAGETETARRIARDVVTAFPESLIGRLVLGFITAYDGDLAGAAAIAAAAPGDALRNLRLLVEFLQSAHDLPPAERSTFVRAALAATLPVTYIVQAGMAAHAGEADAAFDYLLGAIRAHRPLAYDANDEGRGVARANTSGALFGFHSEALRHDPRFAEVCVRLGLHDYWRSTGQWPDCIAEIAPFYDFAASAKAASDLARQELPQP